jgi:quercetin dioxygenase-like cupin family protein
MHVVGTLEERFGAPAAGYAGHAEGLRSATIVDAAQSSQHMVMTVHELEPGGRIDQHRHAFEEAVYVLGGSVVADDRELGADQYALFVPGRVHGFENRSDAPARWLELQAPQPNPDAEVDTDFGGGEADGELPVGRFDVSQLPEPSGVLGLAGFGTSNVGGASLKMLVDTSFGATLLNMFVVQYAPGGEIKEHDHPFEEGFVFVSGEITATLDGREYTLRAGDYCWSGVRSMHALVNRTDAPVRWVETQAPQPPAQHAARFRADWQRLTADSGS